LAAYGGGLLRVWFGTYQVAFTTAGLLALGAAILVLTIRQGRRPAPSTNAPSSKPRCPSAAAGCQAQAVQRPSSACRGRRSNRKSKPWALTHSGSNRARVTDTTDACSRHVPADVHLHAPASATADRCVPLPIRASAQLC